MPAKVLFTAPDILCELVNIMDEWNMNDQTGNWYNTTGLAAFFEISLPLGSKENLYDSGFKEH